MEHYKSWSGLNKLLTESLCGALSGRITYFLTRYHDVHNSYGRAAIQLDGDELICFKWIEMYRQDSDLAASYAQQAVLPSNLTYNDIAETLKPKWDSNCTYSEMDFLDAVLQFRSLTIKDALKSDNYIIKILAIMDRRVGKRTLAQIADSREFEAYPFWVRQFYMLRLSFETVC